jgi:hypothetical protein
MGRLRSIGNSFHTCPDGTPPRLATTGRMDYPTEGDRRLRMKLRSEKRRNLTRGSAKNARSPLPAAEFFWLRFLLGRLLQLGGEFVLHFADLVQHFVERFRGQLLACHQRPCLSVSSLILKYSAISLLE